MINYQQILKNAKSILLVDWPAKSVPAVLIKAGFTVYSYSPGNYSRAQFEAGTDELVFRPASAPFNVDIVNVFRPEEEHAAIIAQHVLPLNAKVLWLHPPIMSANTAALAAKHALVFIEGVNMADVAARLG